ncbi:MAG: hypothetical protein K6E29_08750 [Cyanobacteria bacterium RUI128]|nr:hypothetical protein [Cyanobacteria bacterium RUI128]
MDIKKILITFAVLMLFCMPTFAAYVDNFSRDCDIKNALVLLENVGANEVFQNLEENSVKITFYDLSQVSYKYMNHFAINTIDSFGNRYILINTKYKKASPEELACIIAHESFHKLKVATLEEETLATQKEAMYWNLLKKHHKDYAPSALLTRLNSLVQLDKDSTANRNLIRERISNSEFYREQLAIR